MAQYGGSLKVNPMEPPPATARLAGDTECSGPTTTTDEGITVAGPTQAYVRGTALEFHFCPACGCVAFWRGLKKDEEGRVRIAVNLRLAEPDAVAGIPIDHFDGLDTFEDLPRDGRCVADYWF